MRRGVAVLVLLVVGFGAVWCLDGCIDPMTAANAPVQAPGGSCCVVCVVPFTTTPAFSLPERTAVTQPVPDRSAVHLWMAPTFAIEHPPRTL